MIANKRPIDVSIRIVADNATSLITALNTIKFDIRTLGICSMVYDLNDYNAEFMIKHDDKVAILHRAQTPIKNTLQDFWPRCPNAYKKYIVRFLKIHYNNIHNKKTKQQRRTKMTNTNTIKLPYKVKCTQCGSVKAVRHDVLLKRLVKHEGTLEERLNKELETYVCQSCKSAAKLEDLKKQFGEQPIDLPNGSVIARSLNRSFIASAH